MTLDQLARARAKWALEHAGIDPDEPLERASSVTNEVWLTPHYVVRVNRRLSQRLRREAILGPRLPSEVGYPAIVAYGGELGADYLVLERVPGQPLTRQWPSMTDHERRRAVVQLARILRRLHETPRPPALPPADHAPELLDPARLPLVAPLLEALDELEACRGLDTGLLADTRHLVLASTAALEPYPTDHLVHGDLHLQNVLWDGFVVTALVDFEYARGGPPDLDLDMFLRFCAHPAWFVPDELVPVTRAEDYARVPYWLRDEYPTLFSHPYLLERLLLFSLSHDVYDLRAEVRAGRLPARPSALPDSHAYRRIEHTLRGRSHLHRFAGHRPWNDAGGWEDDEPLLPAR